MRCLLLPYFALLCVSTEAVMLCDDKPDGVYEQGCKVFTRCTDGQATIVECAADEVYNPAIEDCDDPNDVAPPCGHIIDCSVKPDGHYADVGFGCHSYYTCEGGRFLGHNFCPVGLVYNEVLDVCDWEHNVYEPCGILPRP
ncbi:hypothetical protein SNE40_002007 [Patella caerulea]|uniref:Chitin-binding type-2 domain-containing protein n=1 Tax=Patella caerulea TaxID=87958 RepID=A0AAN8PYJ9_PATCE